MFTVSVSGVLLLFLMHHSTLKSVDGQIIDSNTLARVITFFEKNYKIYNKKQELQYAVAINVPTVQCKAGFKPSQNNFLTNENAEVVKRDITNNDYPVYKGTELIAAGVQKLSKTNFIHSERLLLNPTVEIPTTPMKNLLNRRDDSCTILYSLNSPCTKTCLNVNSPNKILPYIETWSAHNSIKAFVFKHIFRGEGSIDTLRSGLQRIANNVPLYRCKSDTECFSCAVHSIFEWRPVGLSDSSLDAGPRERPNKRISAICYLLLPYNYNLMYFSYKRVDENGNELQYEDGFQQIENSSTNFFKELCYTITVLTVAQRSLVLIVLLHPCILNAQNVNLQTLAKIVKAFQAKLGESAQYTVALRVGEEKCSDSSYSGEDLITDDVKKTIEKNKVYNSNNLIAAKPLKLENKTEHSEYRLRNYLKDIMNVEGECVIYFTLNSPCLKTCLAEEGEYTIKSSLTRLQNYKGVKALAFKKVWMHDNMTSLRKRLRTIANRLPFYQCEENKDECVLLYEQGGQFALAINVPKEQCKEGYDESSFLKDYKGDEVKAKIGKDNNNIYNGKDLIAAGTTKDEHSEFLLMARNGEESALESLLKNREDGCVIFYTLLSPCIDGCLKNENIISGLQKLKEHTGIKAFVFTHIYVNDKDKENLKDELTKIADYVPLYSNTCSRQMQPPEEQDKAFILFELPFLAPHQLNDRAMLKPILNSSVFDYICQFTVSVSGVLLLFLLHHSTLKSVDGQIIDSNTLARVISFFEQNYKIVINKKQELQYAVAINVPTVQCDAGFNLSKNNFLTNENPTDVKRDITNNSYPVYQGKELIAAGVKKICTNNRIHSERLLLNPTVEIPTTPMQNLLNRRDDSCTILYSLNSPCSKACLNVNSPNNILPNIETWTAHNSIKAFVFKHIFRGEGSIDTLRSGLQRIANYKRVDADGHPRQYATAINVPKVQCQAGFNPSQKNFLTQEDAKM
ncbi:hypothetical protein E1301_Tti023108 [Triplophysa tibetana]|uniref:Uncharacterized protein n=1 Tax=Triplophysa tibetana TaxID=1572043 RepID=A0A5A9MU26_9TELE|nr:hypothetical protein E1301_Tti023108 [Triplophysa tibetana]